MSSDRQSPRLGISALAQDAAIYGATRVLLKSLAFLLVPLYAHFLSPSEFGLLGLVLATVALVDVLITANMDGVFARFYFERDEPGWRRQIITLYLLIESLYPAVVVGAAIALSQTVSDRVIGAEEAAVLLVIALADVYLTNIVDLPMILCRLRRKPLTFAFYSLTRGLTQVVCSILLVAVWQLEVKGILIASLVSVCLAFLLTLREYVPELTRQLSWRVGREMVSFAWPGVVGGLAFYVLNLFDRFFVKHYHGLEDVGLYEVAFRYSQVVLVGVLAFRMGWTQWHYSWLSSDRHPQMVARGGSYYFLGAGFLAALVSLWILPAFHLLMPAHYWGAAEALPPLALAGVLTGSYTLFAVGLNVTKRMRLLPPIALTGAAVAVGLYFALVPPFSYVGAAWATAAALLFLSLLVLVVSQRIYPVPWEWQRIGLALTVTTGLCLSALALDAWVPFTPSLPLRLALSALYPLALVVLRFFPPGDLKALGQRLRPS